MEDVKKSLINKDLKGKMQISIVITIFLILFETALCFWNKVFVILVWVPIVPLLLILKRRSFFKNAEFCYGTIVDVTINDNDDVYMYTKIEIMDFNSKKINETVIEEHWGDFKDEDKGEINEFYEEGKKRIGKKVPLFYKKENPNKNIIFVNSLED